MIRQTNMEQFHQQSEVVMVHSAQTCLDSEQRAMALAIAMAGTVETAVEKAIAALLAADSKLARSILEKEHLVSQIEMQLDDAVLSHLAHNRLPVEELRFMSSMLKINQDLERMGGLAANIARNVIELDGTRPALRSSELQPLAIAASHLCRKALQALIRRDAVLAQSALESGEAVHQYRDYVFHHIRERLGNAQAEVAADVNLLLASRYLEQIASNALNLADNLVFWLTPTSEDERVAC